MTLKLGGVKHGHVSIAGAFIGAGHTGVSLFFILSGFLLSPPFLREAWGGRRADRRAYLERRALRILPGYWFAVLTASIVLSNGRPAEMLHGVELSRDRAAVCRAQGAHRGAERVRLVAYLRNKGETKPARCIKKRAIVHSVFDP